MRLRFVTGDIFRHRRRVRRAERIVAHDKVETSLAYDRFRREVIASPSGLATFAALGFLFDRRRGSDDTRSTSISRMRLLATLVIWGRQIFT